MATIDPNHHLTAQQVHDPQELQTISQKVQQLEAQRAAQMSSGQWPFGGGGAGGYVPSRISGGTGTGTGIGIGIGGVSGIDATVSMVAENEELKRQIRELTRALKNPDVPLARSVKQLVDTIDAGEIAGRTVPPFGEAMLSHAITKKGTSLSSDALTIQTRDGRDKHVRVVGMIVREEVQPPDTFGRSSTATYAVPFRKMTEGDAFEAIADLIADIVMRRVMKQMEEEK